MTLLGTRAVRMGYPGGGLALDQLRVQIWHCQRRAKPQNKGKASPKELRLTGGESVNQLRNRKTTC